MSLDKDIGKLQEFLLLPKELDVVRLPEKIVLETLVGKPTKCEMDFLGGLLTETVRIFTFKINYKYKTKVHIVFHDCNKSFIQIYFTFLGLDRLSFEANIQLLERTHCEELSVIKQALEILKRCKRTVVYCTSLEKRIAEIIRFTSKRNDSK